MILHTVMVTYDRLYATQKALASYFETISLSSWTLTIVDNGSTDGTVEWLEQSGLHYILLDRNMYPGYACNRGWEQMLPETTHLHRADNDWAYHPGWCDHLIDAFQNRKIGQVGLRTQEEEPVKWNVGGNCVIRRELWDKGLRYDERPWPELPPGHSEDTYLSPAVQAMGYRWTRVKEPCIYGVSVQPGDPSKTLDPYYQRSYAARRIYGFK